MSEVILVGLGTPLGENHSYFLIDILLAVIGFCYLNLPDFRRTYQSRGRLLVRPLRRPESRTDFYIAVP